MAEPTLSDSVIPAEEVTWLLLAPPFAIPERSATWFRDFAATVAVSIAKNERDGLFAEIDAALEDADEDCLDAHWQDRYVASAACQVLADLAKQGWSVRADGDRVLVAAPREVSGDIAGEKDRVRRQELVKRDVQLQQPAAREFVNRMERRREFNGRFVSVFSLMRDGRELARSIEQAAHSELDASVMAPYLQFVDEGRCETTGLRLMDIWRYFRHGWTNQYVSTPGRGMMFLVRDAAVDTHPIIGIGAIASPIVQVRERDTWIGWHPSTFVRALETEPTVEMATWFLRLVQEGIDLLYVQDFLEEELLSTTSLRSPTTGVVEALRVDAREKRAEHHRLAHRNEHKGKRASEAAWDVRARSALFRSKRAGTLADLLEARITLKQFLDPVPSVEGLRKLLADPSGRQAVTRLVRKAKGDRVGILMADISVCGAVPPYNALTGGKLVAMLAASPEVVAAYHRRYAAAVSEIASAMAGRPIVKAPVLAFLGTTSLYGVGSSQYNRISVPAEVVGGDTAEAIRYRVVGKSKAFGTSQFSDTTVRALATVVNHIRGGQRVNSIFGEGHSPRLRKVRDGLDVLHFPTDKLLQHGRPRVIYCVSLVKNLRDFLLGIDQAPDFIFDRSDPVQATERIAEYWRIRWGRKRAKQPVVLEQLRRHTLILPVSHGARVPLPPTPGEPEELPFV